jgi:hypothetical protein
VDEVVRQAVSAMERSDWEKLRLLLHPYLHWIDPSGVELRGRKKVIEHLAASPPPGPPALHELRDGQIYRWQEKTRN